MPFFEICYHFWFSKLKKKGKINKVLLSFSTYFELNNVGLNFSNIFIFEYCSTVFLD